MLNNAELKSRHVQIKSCPLGPLPLLVQDSKFTHEEAMERLYCVIDVTT
jgi:hypothetical protein